jgi:hypothetical protein
MNLEGLLTDSSAVQLYEAGPGIHCGVIALYYTWFEVAGSPVAVGSRFAGSDPKRRERQMRRAHGKREERPLWYLHPQRDGGTGWNQRLGEIGGRIVSEEFFGLVEGNPNFFLSRERHWKPGQPSRVEDNFTMGDLLRLVGEHNPLSGF